MPVELLLPVAASATDQIERWSPVVLLAIGGGIMWLRRQDRLRGPDDDEDDA